MKWSSFGIGAVAGALVAVVFVSCGLPALEDNGLEAGPLLIISGADQSNGRQRQQLVDQWNRTNPDTPAQIEELALGADDQYFEMVGRAQGNGRMPDIYNLDVTWTAEFAERGYISPLDESELDTSGFIENPLATCRYDGKLWALPFNTDAGLMYYRSPDVKAPSTWDEMVDGTRSLFSGPHDSRLRAGYTTQLADYEGLAVNGFEMVWGAGGEVVDEDGEVRIDSPKAKAGLRRLADGLNSGPPQIIPPEARSQDETASMIAFGEGKVAYMRNWPVAFRNMDNPDAEDAKRQLFFEVAPLPGPSVLGGQNLAISSGSPRKQAAQALIEFLTSPRSQQILFERGGFAATRSIVYEDAEVQRRHPYWKVLRDSITRAKHRPVTKCYVQFSRAFRDVINQMLDSEGKVPPNAKERLTAALKC
ncbi:extracellular solute-binding protein [Kibdelosporangium persicum]|uniref:Maltose/maltodextrin ABC transporter, substrate binding periplasmic protein MalE n=1 Tax=Kibdelosporangium persicum TaxID=2698649 RepID=A0ABX2EWF3_9PSEU|nr:extracellular solute-binding protein [Kibdelosporangium persicum]NRN63140.1 Maltose/maltodextrin ABC transporter, substrate binding periplasmic protein MalE [Kibdelosporangium persicum]